MQICTVLHRSPLAIASGLELSLKYLKAETEVGRKTDYISALMQISLMFTVSDFIFFSFSIRYITAAATYFPTGRLLLGVRAQRQAGAVCSQQAPRPALAVPPLHARKAAGLQPGKPWRLSIAAEVSSLSSAVT